MKIIFQSDDNCHGTLIFDTDWTLAKRVLDMIWADMTIDAFNSRIEKENNKNMGKMIMTKCKKKQSQGD